MTKIPGAPAPWGDPSKGFRRTSERVSFFGRIRFDFGLIFIRKA